MARKKTTATDSAAQGATKDEEINLDPVFADLITKATDFVTALDAISQTTYDKDENDLYTDQCGQAVVASRELRTEYKKLMKEYTGLQVKHTAADGIANKLTAIRKAAQGISKNATEVIAETQQAQTALAALAALFKKSNAPKTAAKLARAKKAQEANVKRIARLEAMMGGADNQQQSNG